MAALFLAEEWDRAGSPMSALNCQLSSFTAEERETHCMVLRVHDEKEWGQHNKVKLITPCLHKSVEHFDVKNADINWLLSPEMYFTQVPQLKDIKNIVGHFPLTSTAAIAMKDRFFPTARAVLINHGIESPLADHHLKEAQEVDVVFSVGKQTYDEYSNCYRRRDIDHKLYLPRPDKVYFDLDIDVGREEIPKKQILTSTVGSKIDSEYNRILASAIGDVVTLFDKMNGKPPSWHIRTNISLNCEVIRRELNNYSECRHITPIIHPTYGCQDELCTDLLQSYLCIIPPDESYGMQGLESIAAGLPVLAPIGSSVGDLITVICPLFASCLLYDSTSKDDLSKKIIDALSRPEIAAERAKELKKQYRENREVSTTNQDFLSHFVTSSTAMTYALSRDSTCENENQPLSLKTEINTELPIGITSPGPQSPQSDVSSDGTQPLSPTLEEDKDADHSLFVDDKANNWRQPALETVKNMDKMKIRKRKKKSIEAEVLFKIEEKKMKLEKEKMELEKEKMEMENRKKIDKMTETNYNTLTQLLTSGDPLAESKIKQLNDEFYKHKAILEKPVRGSLLFPLSYLSVEDMEYFWQRYKSGEVEETLTGILISPEIQSMAEEAGFTVRIVLKIDEMEFNELKQIMKEMTVPSPSMKTFQRSPVYDNWERYVLDHVPNIHHARYLMEQSRFDPVLNTLRHEEFFYPTFVSYWYQNMYSLPPSVTKATEYAIMYHVQIHCKEHNLDQDRLRPLLQGRFEGIGKILYDNISEENIGKLYTSWIDSDVSDIKSYLYGLVKEYEDCFTFCNLFVYTYIIACYLSADIRSGGKCLPQLLDKNILNFYDNKLPLCCPYVSGILRDNAGMLLKEYAKHLYIEYNDVYLSLERLGYFLLEISGSSVLASEFEQTFGKQVLDLSNCKTVSNQAIHAFAAVIQNTNIIEKVVLYSDKEETSLSEEFKLYVGKVLSEPRSTNKICCKTRNSLEFISLVKLLRALPILYCCTGKSEPLCWDDCYIPYVQSVAVNASSLIDSVDECFVEMLLQALEWMPLLRRLDLVGVGSFCRNILQCITKVKPKLTIERLSLAQNELSYQHCEQIRKAVELMSFLKYLDLQSNNIGSVGCATLLPMKDDVEVAVEDNGVGDDLVNILSMASDQTDIKISATGVRTLTDFHQLQRSLESVTKLDACRVPENSFLTFCDNLSLFTKTKHLILRKKRPTLQESKLLQASLKHLQEITHLDIEEETLDMQYLMEGPSKFPQLIHLALSHSNIGDHGAKHFARNIGIVNKVAYLDLSYNKIGDAGAKHLFKNPWIMRELTHFNMSHNYIGDHGVDSLSQEMHKMKKITHLDLSHNMIGDLGMESLKIGMVRNDTLTYFDLSHNYIGDHGADSLSAELEKMKIRHLDLSHNRIGDHGMKSLTKDEKVNKSMYIDLSHNEATVYGEENWSEVLEVLDDLVHLNLSHCKIGDSGAERLGSKIFNADKLAHLILSDNDISDTGAQRLSQGMDGLYNVTFFDLSFNRIGNDGAGKLATGMRKMEKLMYLDLGHNSIGDYGIECLIKSVNEMDYITHLSVSHNDIGDYGAMTFGEGIGRKGDLAFLDLSHNRIGDPGAEYFSNIMVGMESLTHFDLSHNFIRDRGAEYLREGMCKIYERKHPEVIKCSVASDRSTDKVPYLDLSHNRIGDDGITSFSRVRVLNNTDIDLSHNEVTVYGAENWSEVLDVMDNLVHLNLSHCKIGDSGAERLGSRIGSANKLTHLILSDNDISDIGIQYLSQGMNRLHNVTVIDLSFNKIGDTGVQKVAGGIENMEALMFLDFAHNSIGDNGMETLSAKINEKCHVRHINLSHNNFGDRGVKYLAGTIGTMEKLIYLDLSHNCISDDGAVSLSGRTHEMHQVKHLDLSGNRIGDRGVESLSEGIYKMCCITHIDLSHNNIGDNGAHMFGRNLKNNKQLEYLNLSHNDIGDRGVAGLSEGMMYSVKHLDLSHNKIGDNGVDFLVWGERKDVQRQSYLEGFGNFIFILSVTHLDLSHNKIGDRGARILGEKIKHMEKLEYLDLSHNYISDFHVESVTRHARRNLSILT